MASWKALVSVGFVVGLVALTACSEGELSSMCSGGHLSVSSQVVATPPFDSVEIFVDGEAVDSSGTPCATATSGDCMKDYRAVAKSTGARFVTTRGNEVTVRENVTYIDVGGSTDTPEEATLIVMGSQLAAACTTYRTVEARAVGGGFEVVTTRARTTRESCATEVRTSTPVDATGAKREPVQSSTRRFGCDLGTIAPWGGEPRDTEDDAERYEESD